MTFLQGIHIIFITTPEMVIASRQTLKETSVCKYIQYCTVLCNRHEQDKKVRASVLTLQRFHLDFQTFDEP
jgi:hypothetical protein